MATFPEERYTVLPLTLRVEEGIVGLFVILLQDTFNPDIVAELGLYVK